MRTVREWIADVTAALQGRRALQALVREEVAQQVARELGRVRDELPAGMADRLLPGGPPNLDRLHLMVRDNQALALNVKLFGTELAERLWAQAPQRPVLEAPTHVGLTGRLCRQEDIESAWLRHWMARVRMAPVYHRKIWEVAYILQAIHESGCVNPGAEALGFAVGQEPIPAMLAALGLNVLATDLQSDDSRAQAWAQTGQNAAELQSLLRPAILAEKPFFERCRFQPLDMTAIPEDLHGRFDILWSSCSLEHLGSIEAGITFIEKAMLCLKPGGVAVHTTEFNMAPGEETIDNWPTVLFRRSDIQACLDRLKAAGHSPMPMDFATGDGLLDGFVDVPPFQPGPKQRMAPHLRLNVDGFPATSIGLIIRARG